MRRLILLAALFLCLPPLAGHAQTAPSAAPAATPPAAPGAGSAGLDNGGAGLDTGGNHHKWQAKFNAANTTHDGHLTLAQAQAAGLTPVVKNFSAIDASNRGYVTFNDIQAWRLEQKAKQMQQQAANLRASD